MDKTSREYAEKLAEEIFEKQNPRDGTIPQWAKNLAVKMFLTAIEETNAKGLLKILEKVETCSAHGNAVGFDLYYEIYEAIRKAKEVTNGK